MTIKGRVVYYLMAVNSSASDKIFTYISRRSVLSVKYTTNVLVYSLVFFLCFATTPGINITASVPGVFLNIMIQ